jgi:ATP-dependent DNA helicase RecQ
VKVENKSSEIEQNEFSFLDPQLDTSKIVLPSRAQNPQVELMTKGLSALPAALKKLSYDKLRPGQDRAVFSLLSQRDTICILPTSGGKSAIYIIPAICMNWRVVIFSPLVSLMKDQVEALWKYRLPAGQISSGQTPSDNQMTQYNWESGDTQFLLAAPERLDNEQFRAAMMKHRPDMVVVDEAHCLSQWGDSFRPSYAKIGDFIKDISPKTVLCITATATQDVESDIRRVLGLTNAAKVVYYPERKNLMLRTIHGYMDHQMFSILSKTAGSTIVYCGTRAETERLFKMYKDVLEGGSLVYHGGMTSEERTTNQNLFMSNEVRVMFATNAFGLGVNKADIRNIIHRDTPGTVEAVAQEQGRAGRDGGDSQCVLFVDPRSFETSRWMIDTTYPSEGVIRSVFYKMKMLTNKEGVFQMTIEDLASSAGLHTKVVGSAVGILKASRAIERIEAEENLTKVRILQEHPDEAFQRYINLIRSVAVHTGDGVYEFKMSQILEQGKLKSRKTDEVFKQLDQNGYIKYARPFRGKTTKIIGEVTLVDFERIEKRKALSIQKLQQVKEYALYPDAQKHDYLKRYFGVMT